jgi:PIN like domain
VKFFFDNCMSKKLMQAIGILLGEDRHHVVHLRDMFDGSTPDPVWLQRLGGEGNWIVISSDTRIIKNNQNKQAWVQSGLTAFFMWNKFAGENIWNQSWRLIKWWPLIELKAKQNPGGAGFIVPKEGFKLDNLKIVT